MHLIETLLRKNFGTIIFIIMLSQIINTAQISFIQASFDIDPNENYPVYNLLTMKLNNKSRDGILAQLKIFNSTTGEWQENNLLLSQIQTDLDSLAGNISQVKEYFIYALNTSYIPGELYVLILTPLDSAKIASETTIKQILSEQSVWWYVSTITFDIVPVDPFQRGDTYLKYLVPGWFLIETFRWEQTNGTDVLIIRKQNNITASSIIFNGTQWIDNEPFNEVLYHDFSELEERFCHDFNISLYWKIDVNSDDLSDQELYSSNISIFQLAEACTIDVKVRFSSLNNDTSELLPYHLLFRTILNKFWYSERVIEIAWHDSNKVSAPNFIITIVIFPILMLIRYFQRKKQFFK